MTAPPRFTLRLEEEGALLYDRRAHQYFALTAAEAFLLTSSLEVPLADAQRLLAESVGARDAAKAKTRLVRDGALVDGRFEGRVVELRGVKGGYGAPLVCHLGLTLACNFACEHCYSSSGKPAKDELLFEEQQRLVEQLHAMGCMKLVLGGGEPFLREELPDLVAYAATFGIDCFVHTNASLLEPAALARLAACPPAALAVSLDGPDQPSNDAVRGARAFARTLAGIEVLKAHYPPGFNLSATVTPRNALLTPGLVELAQRLGATVLLLRPAYPAGEAMADPSLVCDRDTFARAIDLARPRAKALGVTLDAPHPYEQGVPDFEGFGCVAARVVLGVDPRGDVTPCLNLPGAFVSGNIRSAPLQKLWRSGKSFVAVRAQAPNPQCASCRHYDTCRGGCRVRALYVKNGLNGPDSWCHYEPRDAPPPPRARRPSKSQEKPHARP